MSGYQNYYQPPNNNYPSPQRQRTHDYNNNSPRMGLPSQPKQAYNNPRGAGTSPPQQLQRQAPPNAYNTPPYQQQPPQPPPIDNQYDYYNATPDVVDDYYYEQAP